MFLRRATTQSVARLFLRNQEYANLHVVERTESQVDAGLVDGNFVESELARAVGGKFVVAFGVDPFLVHSWVLPCD